MIKKGKVALILLSVLLIVFLAYGKMFYAFFQQDEWWGYSQYILHRTDGAKELISYFFAPSLGHFTPLTLIVLYGLFSFGMNYHLFATVSILLHLVSVFLVYWFAKLIFKDLKLAILTALLFGLSASAYQGTSWVAADIATHGATIFGLLSSIFFFKYLDIQKVKYLYFSLVILFVSLLFKEIGVGLLVFFPILFIALSSCTKKEKFSVIKTFLVICLIYIVFRGSMLFIPQTKRSTTVFQYQSSKIIAYNFLTVPIKAISQSILPEAEMRNISELVTSHLGTKLTGQKGSVTYEVFVTEKVAETLSLTFSMLLIVVSICIFLKNKSNGLAKIMISGLIWIIINSLIFAFAPERSGVITIIDSRYLYFVSIGTTFFIVSLTYLLLKNRRCVFFVLTSLVILNIFWLDRQLSIYVEKGTIRKRILNTIKRDYSQLPLKVIFYTESDKSYYGLPPSERIMPFQSGFGQTLLVWYTSEYKFPNDFFQNKFLWGITDQGYKELDDQGFGYFRDFSKLVKAVEDEKLSFGSVISFRYDSESQMLTDNTNEVRGRLKGYFSDKQEINSREIDIFASTNPKKTSLMLDGKRNTFWDSKLPYALPQFIQIKLSGLKKIAAISIDSYNNKDQNEVGYAVYLSNDSKVWEEVFYSKRYPPGENGMVDIYLLPKITRFVKIQQIGYHKYAPWVIHELKIYEVKN